ncbi:MAG: hypothetical protein WB586_04725 [Chthoniobacterales bacterium]
MRYRAEFRRNGNIVKTRLYSDREEAQDALMKRIGHFHYLGRVCRDGVWTDGAATYKTQKKNGRSSLPVRVRAGHALSSSQSRELCHRI